MTRFAMVACVLTASMIAVGCSDESARPPAAPSPSPGTTGGIDSDAALLALVTEGQPFSSYVRFPDVDVIRSGTSAHQPFVRVSMNQTAFAALQNGRLPAGSTFPNGSVLFKEVLTGANGAASVYTIMYKDRNNAQAGNGWLWAEYSPNRSVVYSISNRGGACVGCHSLEQGPQHDLVRTFERQQ
jgi:hypothetical protein